MSKLISFSLHARRQIREREIPEELINKVLPHPAQIIDSYGNRKIAQDMVRHKGEKFLLRIVFEEIDKELKVVTVYLTTRVEKYWRK